MERTSRAVGLFRIAGLVVTTALSVSACGSPTPTRSLSALSASPPGSPESSLVPAETATAPASLAATPASATPGQPGTVKIDLRTVARGFDQPVFVAGPADGSGRLFVVEQPGRIRVVRDGQITPTPFLDISNLVSCCGERGLLGLALAPGFGETSGAFFVDYTDRNGDTVIARGTSGANGASNTAGGPVQTVLQIGQPFPNHKGGMLAFGPDGDLYVGMGDGGSGGDPQGNGQRLGTLLGKIVRIDVTSDPGSGRYMVPPTNPFLANSAAHPEIWAVGMRNPWRFSFDRANGDLWIGDVGQDQVEEIDVGRAAEGGGSGLNYGWNRMEGTRCFKSIVCDRAGLTEPFTEYAHGSGDCAVIGGYVYRGSAIAGLQGTYLFADECSGLIRAVAAAGPPGQEPVVLLPSGRSVSSFGEDEAGELYLTDLASGDLLQVVAAAP